MSPIPQTSFLVGTFFAASYGKVALSTTFATDKLRLLFISLTKSVRKVSWQKLAALYKINCFKNRNNQNELVMKVVLIVLELLNRTIFRWIQLIFVKSHFK